MGKCEKPELAIKVQIFIIRRKELCIYFRIGLLPFENNSRIRDMYKIFPLRIFLGEKIISKS